MKVLSIRQPWASLIIAGVKKVEYRTWDTHYRGPLLIHASVKKVTRADMEDPIFNMHIKDWNKLPYGAIIGKVNLIDCLYTNFKENRPIINKFTRDQQLFQKHHGIFGFMIFGFLLDKPRRFRHPIPAKGKLNLWNYEL